MYKVTFLFFCMIFFTNSCSKSIESKIYTVNRLSHPININGEWDGESWKDIPALKISNYMGTKPYFTPIVHAKIAYDDEAIYVIFQVKDKYIRIIHDKYQDPVSEDSCVEFFFTPDSDISKGYFNLEMNGGGTALFAYHNPQKKKSISIPKSEFNKIEIAHSLPKIVKPERRNEIIWTIEYRIPINILTHYVAVSQPAPGVKWKANLYNCGDKTSNPHWLTWSVVDYPTPSFHRPAFFGTLKFD